MKSLPYRRIIALAGALVFAPPAFAGSPRVTSVFSRWRPARRGNRNRVSGRKPRRREGVLLFDEPGFEIAPVATEKGKFKVKVKVGPNVRLGEHTFRVVTASRRCRSATVLCEPVSARRRNRKQRRTDKSAARGRSGPPVFGTTPGEDQDRFEVEAKKKGSGSASRSSQRVFRPNEFTIRSS